MRSSWGPGNNREGLHVGWRLLIIVTAALLCGGSVRAAEFMAGADISALPVYEGKNAVYRDGGVAKDVIDMFQDHGVNWYRLRLFVDPSASSDAFVVNDLPYTIALAQRVKAAGGKLLLDFHYSDTWADPGVQTKPAAWTNLSFSALTTRVHDYTRDAVAAFKTAGVAPQMVQIGNEITNGLLWNDGYPWSGGNHNAGFDKLATLLSAGIDGAKTGAGPGDEPLIMIHHDKGSDWNTARFFFDKLEARHLDYDVIGYSYYPKFRYNPTTHAGGIADLRSTLANSATTYNKPVVLVETGFASRSAQGEPTYEFPLTPAGQRQFLDAVVDAVRDVPGGLGAGVFWWYPEARPASGLSVWESGRYGWFDQNGNLLSTIDAYAGLNPVTGDYNGDGAVDAEDLDPWQLGYGQSGAGLAADGNGDGRVDGADLLYWQQRAAAAGIRPAGSAVPEPATLSLWIAIASVRCGISRRVRLHRRG